MSLNFAAVLFLPRSGILKPDLCNPFTKTSHLGYPLEVLAVGITVQLKISLKHRELLFGEGCSDALCFATLAAVLGVTILRRGRVVALNYVQVVGLAEQPSVQESKLFTRGQLAGTGIAGKTR